MKKINLIFSLFLIFSCGSDDSDLVVSYQERVTTILNQSPETNPLEDSSLFFSDLSYGTAERNTYDILLPKDGAPIGVVIFFHGGSFLFNDKSDTYEAPFDDIIKNLISQKVAIVNANYSYLTSTNSSGVFMSLRLRTTIICESCTLHSIGWCTHRARVGDGLVTD